MLASRSIQHGRALLVNGRAARRRCGASAPVPDEGDLVDWLAEVMADAAGLDQVMVRDPAHLYGFDDR